MIMYSRLRIVQIMFTLSFCFFLCAALPIKSDDVYFLTRDGQRLELPHTFQLDLKKSLVEENRIQPQDIPSAYFYPLGIFVIGDTYYDFYLFYIKDKASGYYYDSLKIFHSDTDTKKIRHLLIDERKLRDEDITNFKMLFGVK